VEATGFIITMDSMNVQLLTEHTVRVTWLMRSVSYQLYANYCEHPVGSSLSTTAPPTCVEECYLIPIMHPLNTILTTR
jgi:hypothetical protein